MAASIQVDGIMFTLALDANGNINSATTNSYPNTTNPVTVQISPPLDPQTDNDSIVNAIVDALPDNLDNADQTAIQRSDGASNDPNSGAIRQSYGGG